MSHCIFVYGTLKRGQIREKRWPYLPERIDLGYVHAALFDLGPYPAIIEGQDRILGEIWTLAPNHLAATIRVLDRIEWFGQDGNDLYVRQIVTAYRSDDNQPIDVQTYFYANPAELLESARRIEPNRNNFCQWPAGSNNFSDEPTAAE